jgi:hypothetical protein
MKSSFRRRLSRYRSVRSLDLGFTLLEAVVAVAIVGLALVPLIIFISQMVTGLTRAADSNAINLAKLSILEFLDPLNPLEYPVGQDKIGDLSIHWESTNIVPPNEGVHINAGLAGFSLGFYRVHVSVERPMRGVWFTFDMRKVGYRRIGSGLVPGAPQ